MAFARLEVRGLDLLRSARVEGVTAPLAPFAAEEEREIEVGVERDADAGPYRPAAA